jgi:RHS repeat-associated protein
VETRTWFHTGIYYDQGATLSEDGTLDYRGLTKRYGEEFNTEDGQAFELGPNAVELGGTPHEAYRALRGAVLRTEVYARDGSDKEEYPYQVTQSRYRVKQLQPKNGNNHAVYHTTQLESLTYHYERNPKDPRIGHEMTLAVDDFGNVTDSVSIAYPRREVPADLPEQGELKIVYTKSDFINKTNDTSFYYIGVLYQTRKYEVTGLTYLSRPLQLTDFTEIIANSDDFLPFEQTQEDSSRPSKRIIEWSRNYFRTNQDADTLDVSGTFSSRLQLNEIESLALPYESYQAALTDALVASVYGNDQSGSSRVIEEMLKEAGYHREPGLPDVWWVPSGRQAFKADAFYLPHQSRDPFGNVSSITYDAYGLLVERIEDPLENIVQARNDYRVLQPDLITDPNGNRAQVVFDALGLVVGTVVMGKITESKGDSLDGFKADLTETDIQSFLIDPKRNAKALLAQATTRIIYDLDRFVSDHQPAYAATLARETHVSELANAESDQNLKIQINFIYSDGFGREIQTKAQAEPDRATPDQPRWVGTGTTIYNNKGKPVQQYEPFFSSTHEFGIEQHGVSPTLFYDPVERVICTLHPNHAYEKVVFDPWQQETWDANDTLLLRPYEDKDVKGYVAEFINSYQHPLDSRPFKSWYDELIPDRDHKPAYPTLAQRAALITEAHAGTPTTAYLDTLGRPFLTMAHNGLDAQGEDILYRTHLELDIEGNDLKITDPRQYELNRGRAADSQVHNFVHQFDLAGRKLRVDSVDAGKRLTLPDINGQPSHVWDANGNEIYTSYDELRRPVDVWVKKRGATDGYLAQKTIYGETTPTSAAANHRGQIWQVYDGAGLVENVAYDFKGNLLVVRRTLLADGTITEPAWARSADPVGQPIFDEAAAQGALDTNRSYVVKTAYDALNRVTRNETPDGTVQEPHYNEANLLEKLTVTHAGSTEDYVTNVEYNARGQRTCIQYGNGVTTEYDYDPDTFRLTRIVSYRHGRSKDDPDLQDLNYTYDPVGNITSVRDDAHQVVFNRNNGIEPESRYTYDPLYRLVEARGREHQAMTPCRYRQGDKKQTDFIVLTDQPLNNGQALGNYTETYTYDESGNFTRLHHHNRTFNRQWTRYQEYEPGSNRILYSQGKNQTQNQTTGQDEETLACSFEDYSNLPRQIPHDGNGNITRLPHLPQLRWDFKNQLVEVQLNVGNSPNRAYYQYDAGGQRVRKTVVKNGRTEERIYLGGYEIYTVTNGSGPTFRRDTIHVMDDKERIALIETRKVDTNSRESGSAERIRYQLTNHLGSAALEVGETNAAILISYEEYYPYGGTSYIAHLAGDQHKEEAGRKRYRYSGKERDDETGLYYYGARFYAPWMGRWTSCDPNGLVDGENLYRFVRSNPIVYVDRDGKQACIDCPPIGGLPAGLLYHPSADLTEAELQRLRKPRGPSPIVKYLKWVQRKGVEMDQAIYGTLPDSYYNRFGYKSAEDYVSQEILPARADAISQINTITNVMAAGALINAGVKYAAFKAAISKLPPAEQAIALEARSIVLAEEFASIRAAHAEGVLTSTTIGKMTIQYEPGLPGAGFSLSSGGERAFLIGPEAFKTEAELIKTVIHETRRVHLDVAAKTTGLSQAIATESSDAALQLSEKVFGVVSTPSLVPPMSVFGVASVNEALQTSMETNPADLEPTEKEKKARQSLPLDLRY